MQNIDKIAEIRKRTNALETSQGVAPSAVIVLGVIVCEAVRTDVYSHPYGLDRFRPPCPGQPSVFLETMIIFQRNSRPRPRHIHILEG